MPHREIEEACLEAEARLREAARCLLDVRPEAVERCQDELQQVIAALEPFVSKGALQANPRVASALLRIRWSAQALRLQIKFASNLYSGWVQLRLGTGYTRQGLPVFVTGAPGRSFEA
ncbi:MAG TPA: hypothetical protein VGG72_19205 [Bryobacteraceae bacterium]|jgi:hypothetical protein